MEYTDEDYAKAERKLAAQRWNGFLGELTTFFRTVGLFLILAQYLTPLLAGSDVVVSIWPLLVGLVFLGVAFYLPMKRISEEGLPKRE